MELRAFRIATLGSHIPSDMPETSISASEAIASVAEYSFDGDVQDARRSIENAIDRNEDGTTLRFGKDADYRFERAPIEECAHGIGQCETCWDGRD